MLGVMTKEIAKHVQHEDHGREEVQDGGDNGVPETLAVSLVGLLGRNVFVH